MSDAPATSFEDALLEGFAQTMIAECPGLGLAYDPDPEHIYAADEVGIYFDRWPEVPGASVTLTEYTVTDDPTLSDSVVGVQLAIWARDASLVKAITSAVFNAFHGRPRGTLGTVTLVMAVRSSGTNVGQDSNDRQGRTENYYLTVHRPGPWRG